MKIKSLFHILLILALFASQVRSLTFRHQNEDQNKDEEPSRPRFNFGDFEWKQTNGLDPVKIRQLIAKRFALKDPQMIPDSIINCFVDPTMFFYDDDLQKMKKQQGRLSYIGRKHIQNCLFQREGADNLTKVFQKQFDQDPASPQCYKALKQEQKDKYFELFISSYYYDFFSDPKVQNKIDSSYENDLAETFLLYGGFSQEVSMCLQQFTLKIFKLGFKQKPKVQFSQQE